MPEVPVKLPTWQETFVKSLHGDPKSILFTPERDFLIRCGTGAKVYPGDIDGKDIMLVALNISYNFCEYGELVRFWPNLSLINDAISKEHNNPNDYVFVLAAVAGDEVNSTDQCVDYFNQLLSAFPSALAVPYWDEKSRSSLYGIGETLSRPARCYLIDRYGSSIYPCHEKLTSLGSACYPFTKANIRRVYKACKNLLYKDDDEGFSLESILSVPPSSSLAVTANKPDGSTASLPLSSCLKDKVVGLYLCTEGDFMEELYEAYKKLKNKNFIIVLVHQPFTVITCGDSDIEAYQKRVNDKWSSLHSKDGNDWFALPFDEKICRRLWRFCDMKSDDELIIVDSKSEYVDFDGRRIMHHYGLEAFPFTKETFLNRIMSRLDALTLEDFLPSSTELTDHKQGRKYSLSEVASKKRDILLYITGSTFMHDELFEWYEDIKKEYSDDDQFELIMVIYDDQHRSTRFSSLEAIFPDMPWLVTKASSPDIIETIQQKARGYSLTGNLVAAFRDGRVISLCAHKYFYRFRRGVFPTDCLLLKELREKLRERHLEHCMVDNF